MILFPAIWWLFPAISILLILFSLYLAWSGNRAGSHLHKAFVTLGASLGLLALALPLIKQPVFAIPLINFGLGIPLAVSGLVGRVYPMVYLRRHGTTTAMDTVKKLVVTGPYAWVRHPQYSAGFVFMLGWFLAWGAWYALGFLPLLASLIYAQAIIEEKYILEKEFKEAYVTYRKQVGMLLPRLFIKNPLRVTTTFLGFYAGLLAIQHGIFAILQGNTVPDGLMFNAIGPPCQPEAVWHACFPAMTLIPNLLVTGIAAVFAGLVILVWGVAFAGRRHSGWILAALSILLLLVGGGFVPVFFGVMAAIASLSLGRSSSPPNLAFLAVLWPWSMVMIVAWLPGSWLLGNFFGPAMLSVSGVLFFVFDISLPILAVLSGIGKNITERSV
jgi:protein-S-isoprenylcysteine O-methyltransferase Ste14